MNRSLLAVYGSPRKGGNTDTMMEYFLEGASPLLDEIERVFLRDLSLQPCTECEQCAETGECVVQDDMQPLYGKLLSARWVAFSLPVFFLGPPAVSKAFIDRAQALWIRKNVLGMHPREGKGYMLSAGGFKSKQVFSCNRSILRAFFLACGVKYQGEYLIPGADRYGEVRERPHVREALIHRGRSFIL